METTDQALGKWLKTLSREQKITLAWIAGVALMGIAPPWSLLNNNDYVGPDERPAGYSLVFVPPEPTNKYEHPKIDWSRLALQWIIISVAAGGAIALTRPNADRS